ncbi:MAG: hypothetical protein MI861_18295, partial [Pirellulales bacterium]|nr:hypothetical protein [Pirellulales bacterium]
MILATLLGKPVDAQGLLDSDRDKAIEYMAEFAAAVEDLPKSFAVVVRSNIIFSNDLGKHHERDMHYVYAENDDPPARFSATGFWDDRGKGFGHHRKIWEQRLAWEGRLYHRAGRPHGEYARGQDELLDIDPKDSHIVETFKEFHPFYFPVSRYADRAVGQVDRRFGLRLLEKLELQSTRRDARGNLHSTWKQNRGLFSFAFDKTMGNRPSRMTLHLGADDSSEPEDDHP